MLIVGKKTQLHIRDNFLMYNLNLIATQCLGTKRPNTFFPIGVFFRLEREKKLFNGRQKEKNGRNKIPEVQFCLFLILTNNFIDKHLETKRVGPVARFSFLVFNMIIWIRATQPQSKHYTALN